MNTLKKITYLSLLFLIGLMFNNCQNKQPSPTPAPTDNHLGEISFEVEGTPEAQEAFKEGLLRLHSFEFADARAAFEKAIELDPSLSMAYWGAAMTHNHPLWRNQATDEAKAILNKLGDSLEDRLAKANNELEKDFLQAVEHLFYGEEDKFARDQAYSDWMGKMNKKYPDNHEVAAFYALSILGAVPVGMDQKAFNKSAGIAQSILDENPNHPGALHYLIHAYDNPNYAIKAKLAADKYAKVAPDAAHALHMPSHIYVALGLWHEVVSSNIASYEASVKRMERMELDNDGRSYHAYAWLLYGYVQQGQLGHARRMMEDMIKYHEEKPSRGARSYLIDMKAHYLLHSELWEDTLANVSIDVADLNIAEQSAYYFIEGMKAYKAKNQDFLDELIVSLRKNISLKKVLVSDTGVPMCNSAGSYGALPNQTDIDESTVMLLEMEALSADLQGKAADAEEKLKAAVELENKAPFGFGPPRIVYPSHELIANWLIDQGRAKEALPYLDEALERGPQRSIALQAKLKAAKALEDGDLISASEEAIAGVQELVEEGAVLSLR